MNRKYEFTGETKQYQDRTLHRIRHLLDGKLGGWIEREINLSHEGACWVDDKAMVFEGAVVSGMAWVFGRAQVFGRAWVSGNAAVYGDARVLEYARVCGDTRLSGDALYTEYYSTTPTVLYGPGWDVVQHPSGLVSIGCEKYPLTYWLENYKDIGLKHRLTEDGREKYGELLHSLQAA